MYEDIFKVFYFIFFYSNLDIYDIIKILDICIFILFHEDNLVNQIKLAKKIASLGICIIKLAQWLCFFLQIKFEDSKSNSLQLILNSLTHLCSNCQKEKTTQLSKHIEELKNHKIISTFNEDMILSASVGQMYLAKSFDESQTLIVKVKHDGLEEEITKWKAFLNTLCNYVNIQNILDLDEFYNYLHLQLDFENEVKNMKIFHKRYRKNNNILIPTVHYFTRDIIVMDYIKSVDFQKTFQEMNVDDKNYYEMLGKCFFMDMIFIQDLVHADLHGGNFGIVPSKKAMVIYDFGWLLHRDKTRDFKKFFLLCHIKTEEAIIFFLNKYKSHIDKDKESTLHNYVFGILGEKKLDMRKGLSVIIKLFPNEMTVDSFMFCVLSLCLYMNAFMNGTLETNMNKQIKQQIKFIEKHENFIALSTLLKYRPDNETIQDNDDNDNENEDEDEEKQSLIKGWFDKIYGDEIQKIEGVVK